jgi:eukaryotic-like serine/threonine-protein kinase
VSLVPGTRLGPYEITAQIGAGGMGEVYRATDTHLKRPVAIKVLPGAVAADVDRLARLQREAEVLASLNHPNIAHIHGLEKSEGTTALVMELVEGQTLAERIAEGPIPIDEALPIAKQIAEALEAAHERGIVHRDLKPANIKLRPDGAVKVLDFGLAKAMDRPLGENSNLSMSPTIPERYAGRGGNVRPGFTFSNVPVGRVSFAIILQDLMSRPTVPMASSTGLRGTFQRSWAGSRRAASRKAR